MKLHIIKPTQKKTIEVQWLDINTLIGNFVIQDQHAPMILVLKSNTKFSYKLFSGLIAEEKISEGIAHITRNFTTLLLTDF